MRSFFSLTLLLIIVFTTSSYGYYRGCRYCFYPDYYFYYDDSFRAYQFYYTGYPYYTNGFRF